MTSKLLKEKKDWYKAYCSANSKKPLKEQLKDMNEYEAQLKLKDAIQTKGAGRKKKKFERRQLSYVACQDGNVDANAKGSIEST